MLRDFKFLRRNSSKNGNAEEIENVPINPSDSLVAQNSTDSTRPPLNSIQEPILNSKPVVDQEVGVKSTKVDRTPTKPKSKTSEMGLRTPEKHGVSMKNRFGWAQKNETGSNVTESRDEGRIDSSSYMSQSSRGVGNGGFANVNTPRANRAAGRANSGYSECNSTQSTPTKSVTKPPNPGLCLTSGTRPRLANFAALSKGIPISCSSSSVVNTVEVPHFDLKEDPAFWMDHNVQVLIRVRPLNSMEKSIQGYNRCLKQDSAQCITWIGQPETRFTFDHVACETVDQETLFRMVGLPMVENCLSGYNSCMFAYGQTGSGKTHTMLGEIEELEVKPSPNRGMTPRIFEFLFARIRAEEESRMDERLTYNCKCSFLEIYNEQVSDLLDPSSTNLLLREDSKKGVYVENLSEFEVQTVSDILKLLSQGSSNRKVAATNMNRESSRSHSVFTCVIESRWEKDSTSNLRFARLNLVDLAGSERQKTSGAEGERLKEAANINKSLSLLGHVIMVLVDVAHGKPKHVPYRDSRLTFLLQDSLGGNSKTTIIANVSPSICCAAETLNTLKFAQRAKLIQNNAVVNEDSSGDVIELQQHIRFLKEELAALKRQTVSRSLSFASNISGHVTQELENTCNEGSLELDKHGNDDTTGSESKGILRMSSKQLKSLETTLTGALRREQMAETSIKQLEAEIEQLNRLVRQREEDSRCSKMMLKFREDKVQRMESVISGLIPADSYLLEENSALSEEVQLLRAKVDRNPEVTRFALENIRLLEQLRRFQDFYEEGEREMLLAEVSELRDQLVLLLDGNSKLHNPPTMPAQEVPHISKENESLHLELKKNQNELEQCRNNLNSCLEKNAKLRSEIDDLRASLNNLQSADCDHDTSLEVIKESILEAPSFDDQSLGAFGEQKEETELEMLMKHEEEVINLQLELDIIKSILNEERSLREKIEQRALCLNRDLELAQENVLMITRQYEDAEEELKEAKSIIEALESHQILSINEIEDLKNNNNHYAELLSKQELRDLPSFKSSESENSRLQAKLKKMHDSLEKSKRLNVNYQRDRSFQESNEEEMDEVRRQVEVETAEVIVCLQEELSILQQQVQDSNLREVETKERLVVLQTEFMELQEKYSAMSEDNKKLGEMVEQKDEEFRTLFEESKELHEKFSLMSEDNKKLGEEVEQKGEELRTLFEEFEVVLAGGDEALNDASSQIDVISGSFSQKKNWVSEKVGMMTKIILEKEILVEELNRCLDDANNRSSEMESMLRSLRGATLVITEAHQQECAEKEKENLELTSELSDKISTIAELKDKVKNREEVVRKASVCATVAFVIVNRFSERNSNQLEELKHKDIQIDEAEKQIQALRMDLEVSKESYDQIRLQLSEEQESFCAMKRKLDEIEENDILKTREKITELKSGVSSLRSCMNEYAEQTGTEVKQDIHGIGSHASDDLDPEILERSFEVSKNVGECSPNQKNLAGSRTTKDVRNRYETIVLLRKEIESALDSLKGVQDELAKLRNEKEEVSMSAKRSQESFNCLLTWVLSLQADMSNFEKQVGSKMVILDEKLGIVEEIVQEAGIRWCQKKEVFERELGNAKADAAQKTTEASCIFGKIEEAQDTMKEADIMINELIIANESLKLDIKGLKKKEATITNDKNVLFDEVQSLKSAKDLQDRYYENLEKQISSDVQDLEGIVVQVQTTFTEDFISLASDFLCMKSQLQDSMKLIQSWLEDTWSEIIAKDFSVYVLHLCHIGILLETVTGLNAENGLLQHGLSESTSVISELREHNFKSRMELETCRVLKGKLLADIKNSFDRIARKEDESGEFKIKLRTFEKKIMDIQLQEELMLQRSNNMGFELAALVKELDTSNINVLASLLDQEKMLKDKEEVLKSQNEKFMVDLYAKDFELVILGSELDRMAVRRENMEKEQTSCFTVLENCKKEIIFLIVDKEVEAALLRMEVEEAQMERLSLLSKLNESNSRIADMDNVNKALEQEIRVLNDNLKGELGEVMKEKMGLSSHVQKLEADYETLAEDMKTKEKALEISSGHVSVLDQENRELQTDLCFLKLSLCELQDELDKKDEELRKISCLEIENESLESQVRKLKAEHCLVLQDLEESKSDLGMVNRELSRLRLSQSVVTEELCSKSRDLQVHVDIVNSLREENVSLRNELKSHEKSKLEFLTVSGLSSIKYTDSVETVERVGSRLIDVLNEGTLALEERLEEICRNVEKTSNFVEEFELLENLAKELISENLSLQTELSRKDDVLKGLLFDLSLLQESASNTKDQKDEIEELVVSIEALEDELEIRSRELDETVVKSLVLEAKLQEKIGIITSLELDISKDRESVKSLSIKNLELMSNNENALEAKKIVDESLAEKRKEIESLEMELVQIGAALEEMTSSIESLRCDFSAVSSEKDDLCAEVSALKEKFEMAQALAEENEAIALEAQQIAETRKVYAEDKEEEVRLLERSVEELECTVSVLENKVDIIKGEAERQRLEREELELELHDIKQQMNNVECSDVDIKRHLDEKDKELQEAFQRMQLLEREIAARDTEIAQCKTHITELNLHAEAQASEYKQKFKALESMADQVKLEGPSTNLSNSSSNKLEKNGSKPRGSGSPFKCIGLGLAQQLKSEKDEELAAGRLRIEELEALAANRQKEVFMLNARLAAAESMTHDVIRDLLGLKLDMTSYASLLDNQQVQKIAEKARLHKVESEGQDKEVIMLKQQLNEFIKERKGWLEEIDRKQAEMVAAQIALEKFRERDFLLTTENEMFKNENVNNKRKIMELEADVKKLSGQQNLQQRIHHHAKIKEENNILKIQNEDLSMKLRRTEYILSRVKEELAHFRATNGRSPCIDFDEEQRLSNKLKESEEERLQLAHKLLGLCTSILKAAGVTRPASDVNLSVAEDALEQLKNRMTSLERELHDLKFQNKISSERIRLSELMPRSSPLTSRTEEESLQTPNRISQTPFFSAFDR